MEQLEHEGTTYELELSHHSKTGYKSVVEVRAGEFHVKITQEKGGGQVTLPGPACKTAKEAALRLAMFKLNPQPIIKKERARRGEGKVRRHALSPTSPV